MKKFFAIFAATAVLAMGMVACSPKSRLEKLAKAANKSCPMLVEGVGSIVKISYDGTDIVYTTVVDDNLVDIDLLEQNRKEAKEFVLQEFVNPDNDVKELLDALRPADAGIKMVYVSNRTNKEMTIRLSVDEIEAVYNNPSAKASPEKVLQMQVDMANREAPQIVGEGIVLKKVYIEGDYVVFLYDADEDVIDLTEMEANREEMIAVLKDNEGDADIIEFQTDCRNAGKGISYHYVGSNGKTAIFDIPASEL